MLKAMITSVMAVMFVGSALGIIIEPPPPPPPPEGPVPVTIDIKPGSFPNSINLSKRGTIPVAIFSEPDGLGGLLFDASAVDPSTVEMAGAGVACRIKKGEVRWMAAPEDVDGDGWLDMVVHIVTQDIDPALLNLDEEGNGVAVVSGMTADGVEFAGEDSVRIVPPNK